ncbi:MAG: hypothetical protein RL478_1537 [Actinomycetota bacterium]|jgi:hypothetical protein
MSKVNQRGSSTIRHMENRDNGAGAMDQIEVISPTLHGTGHDFHEWYDKPPVHGILQICEIDTVKTLRGLRRTRSAWPRS